MAYSYKTSQFTPKRPVHSFRDLEVYQRTLEASVVIVKDLKGKLTKLRYPFLEHMINAAMSIPLWLGEAHSIRFGNHATGILLLERAMAGCNKLVIYLEQIRGIYGSKLDFDLIESLIKKYAETRGKIFRLEKAWQKFEPPKR
ncbi:MAG: hypothetical protein A3F25_02655 [Candidatus Yanofskybacteria bacterium RIFCSPHIGHO2_12_FULL_45_19b]|uniref:Four helix bundle protein n=1 Tax=Candidatus Yanofskybacteria bacterium RIFCSPHIGHO2_12_FULL_45_19b TaxID=1802689 RepID=A0A1F8G358_9BACT|nr:MAG: hypothetical protein A3F25_02655 [Candidatus Yanofskybacteria bacterium RIFCSPHIGHO2_12_FULL_45_19b]